MALVPETVYSVGREARKLESAALAVTLTNNPAPALETSFNAAAASLSALIVGSEPTQAIISDGDAVTMTNYSSSPIPGVHVAHVVDGTLDHVSLGLGIATVTDDQYVNVLRAGGFIVDGAHQATVGEGSLDMITLDAAIAPVATGTSIPVKNSGNTATVGGTATVAAGVVTQVNTGVNTAITVNGGNVTLQNFAGAAKGTGVAAITTGVISSVRPPTTAAIVTNGEQVTCTVTGSYVSKFTATVSGGVITGIVLS